MATVIKIMSWNIQILGDTKSQRGFLTDLLGLFIAKIGPDVVAIQELVFAHAVEIVQRLLADLEIRNQKDWAFAFLDANPGSSDRDGYLFLWRSSKFKQLWTDKAVQGLFTGDFPNNITPKNGRRVGYVGLTLTDGSQPFIVANYHGPTYATATVGSAPATGVKAIETNASQLLNYTTATGGSQAYVARLLCGDFNLDITEGSNLASWYQPMMNATQTQNITTSKTILYPVDQVKSPGFTNPADYLSKNLDNIFAGPGARIANPGIVNTVEAATDKEIARIFEAFAFVNDIKSTWNPSSVYSRFVFVRNLISDHVPLVTDFTLVP